MNLYPIYYWTIHFWADRLLTLVFWFRNLWHKQPYISMGFKCTMCGYTYPKNK